MIQNIGFVYNNSFGYYNFGQSFVYTLNEDITEIIYNALPCKDK